VDHVVRGNHSGWPFREAVTPFTFSLLVYALLLPGIYMNLRGRVAAGWWVFTASVALALVVLVHFLGEDREAPIRDIYAVYGSPVAGLAALVVLAGLLAGLSALLISALGALRRRT
jgi:small-conductance mechanosensitive channel